jgi:urease accessory protein
MIVNQRSKPVGECSSMKPSVYGIRRIRLASFIAAATLVLASTPAAAHSGTGLAGGFVAGFLHPLFGPDHLVAMVAVGLWGAFLGAPAIWVLPITFPLVMAFGGALGVIGLPIPYVEIGIAASAVILGLMVALAVKPPIWIAGRNCPRRPTP